MNTPNIILYKDYAEINNITSFKEFNNTMFNIEINNEEYIIKGDNLELKEVLNNNTTIKLTGIINSIEKKNIVKIKNKSFIKRLFN